MGDLNKLENRFIISSDTTEMSNGGIQEQKLLGAIGPEFATLLSKFPICNRVYSDGEESDETESDEGESDVTESDEGESDVTESGDAITNKIVSKNVKPTPIPDQELRRQILKELSYV